MRIIETLKSTAAHGNQFISACMIEENLSHLNILDNDRDRVYKDYVGRIRGWPIKVELKRIELILSTRLPDERFRGSINFEKAAVMETPIDEIQKALVS